MWLLVFNYVQRLFLMNGFVSGARGGAPEYPAGLLVGLLRAEGPVVFRWSQVTEPGTLSLIGIVVIVLSLVMGLLLRNGGDRHPRRIYRTLGVLAAVTLAVSPFAKFLLMPIYQRAFDGGHYLGALLLGHLCQEFGIFPYLGYGFIGALTGVALARQEELKVFQRRNHRIAVVLAAVGVMGVVLASRDNPLGERVIGASISYIELAVFLVLTGVALRTWDQGESNRLKVNRARFSACRRFGVVALSIYMLEPLVAQLLKAGVDLVAGPGWAVNLLLVLAFGFICLALWWITLLAWERRSYAGSIERFSARMLFRLSGKRSTKVAAASLRS